MSERRLTQNEHDILLYLAARLNVILCGCQSLGCPFRPYVEGRCGTADVCDCLANASGLFDAIGKILAKLCVEDRYCE